MNRLVLARRKAREGGFGDNLNWLGDANRCGPSVVQRQLFPDASIDLVYLAPPFNSNASYNVLFREAAGEAGQAQFHVFTDMWEWTADVDAIASCHISSLCSSGVAT